VITTRAAGRLRRVFLLADQRRLAKTKPINQALFAGACREV